MHISSNGTLVMLFVLLDETQARIDGGMEKRKEKTGKKCGVSTSGLSRPYSFYFFHYSQR